MCSDRQYLNIKLYNFVFFVIQYYEQFMKTLQFDRKYAEKQTLRKWRELGQGWSELGQGRGHGHTLTEAGVSLGTRTQRLE